MPAGTPARPTPSCWTGSPGSGFAAIIAVTKCDKLSKTALAKQVSVIAQGLAMRRTAELVLFSAKSHQGREALWRAISNLMVS